jgi:hypothetical protein
MCNNNNNNALNNNFYYYGRLKYLILLFKIHMGTRKDFFIFIYNLGTRPQKGAPSLV